MCGGSPRGYTYSAEWYGTLRQYFQVRHAMLVWAYCTGGIRDEEFLLYVAMLFVTTTYLVQGQQDAH